MATSILVRPLDRQWPGISHALKLLVLALLLCLAGCTSGGDQGQATDIGTGIGECEFTTKPLGSTGNKRKSVR